MISMHLLNSNKNLLEIPFVKLWHIQRLLPIMARNISTNPMKTEKNGDLCFNCMHIF
jgi:hypothetical protein